MLYFFIQSSASSNSRVVFSLGILISGKKHEVNLNFLPA